jgi:transcriptional regulator with GAF, ATPase, and Fis domain
VQAGRFRADLFYRLNVFPVRVLPLRERRADIPLLVAAFLPRKSRELGKPLLGLTPEAEARLLSYDWPGNVRELHNALERAAILARSDRIGLTELPALSPQVAAAPPQDTGRPADASLAGAERAHILRVLEQTGWILEGKKGAAELLRMKPSTRRSTLARLGIKRAPRRP